MTPAPSASPIAVVLVSGGMDSCVTAAEARASGAELAFLHGNYGQRTEDRELSCFHALADRFSVPRERRLVIELPHLGRIGGSALTDRRLPVETSPLRHPFANVDSASPSREGTAAEPSCGAAPSTPPELGSGRSSIPTSYVPFRNAHFLVAAVSWAEVIGASSIYVGAVEEDSSGYPDCREVYFRAFENVVGLGTRPETTIRIVTPVIHLDKAAIVKRGLELCAPFELTWSCYVRSDLACGVCDSCVLRLRGFEKAGAVDPIPYARSS